MKKYIIYIGILAIGLLLGWMLFGGSTKETSHNHNDVVEANQMWTCSMHPQIMKPEPGDCPICGMDLIPAENGNDGLLANQFTLTDNALALANIETNTVGIETSSANHLILSGKIQVNDKLAAVQTAHFGGRIEILNFKSVGEFVNYGDVIASIYSPELVTAQNELIEAMDIKNEQPELYKAVRNKLKFWKISEQQIKQIEQTKKVITNFKMYANTKGYIETVFVEEGNHVKEGTPLFKVASINTVWAELDVYEQDVKNISLGQSISININAFQDKKIEGKIDYISPTLNDKTRTISVRATLNNPNEILKPGMLISATTNLRSNDEKGMLSIPKSAVLWTGERSIVYVKVPNDLSVFELREITLGNAVGKNYMVLSGLENGEEIVTNGTFTIDAAAQLQGKSSMMNKKGGKVITGHEGHLEMQETTLSGDNDHVEMNDRIKVSVDFQNQLKTAFNDYLIVKDALVKDNSKKAADNAKELLNKLNRIDMKLLKDKKAHNHWMKLLKEMTSSTKIIAEASNIKEQRNHFKPLSSNLTTAIELFGVNETVYNQFCPMADNDKGAYWLSLTEEIFNPYFGDTMLKCGSVEKTIQ